jgi:RNA polymerase sigma factor (sigma-70 family)
VSARPLIHVIDDDDSLRAALLRLLAAAGYEACGYGSAGDFLLHPPPERPGCLLLDVRMPGPSGLDLQAALQRQGVELPIVFMTGYADLASGVRAMKAGAVDFLAKPVEREALFEALQQALALDADRRSARVQAQDLRQRFDALTERERLVFERVVSGRLNKEIADELGVSERTVKMQRAQVMAKLGAGSAAELGRLAERLHRLTD